MSNRQILVTGGAGFLGSHLTEKLLKEGDEVTVVDILSDNNKWKIEHLLSYPNLKVYRGSVLDKDLMDKLIWKSDVIFHFAAIVGVDHYVTRPYDVLDVNINGTRLVLDLAYKYNKKVIFASTSEVYGKSTKIPFKEDGDRVLGPTTIDRWCYSTSKAVGEHFCLAYYQKGLSVVILRFFNAYGPRLDSLESGRVISIFMGQLLSGKPLTIIGKGEQTRCFTYVDDIIDGIILSSKIKEAEGNIFNLGTDVETSIGDLAKMMVEIYGKNAKIDFVSSDGIYGTSYEDIARRVPDISKARKMLGFDPKIPLKDGLKITVDWFVKNQKSMK